MLQHARVSVQHHHALRAAHVDRLLRDQARRKRIPELTSLHVYLFFREFLEESISKSPTHRRNEHAVRDDLAVVPFSLVHPFPITYLSVRLFQFRGVVFPHKSVGYIAVNKEVPLQYLDEPRFPFSVSHIPPQSCRHGAFACASAIPVRSIL